MSMRMQRRRANRTRQERLQTGHSRATLTHKLAAVASSRNQQNTARRSQLLVAVAHVRKRANNNSRNVERGQCKVRWMRMNKTRKRSTEASKARSGG